MTRITLRRLVLAVTLAGWALVTRLGVAAEPVSFDAVRGEYAEKVQPLLKRLCIDCHSTELKEGQLDLERFKKFDDVRTDPHAWQKVAQMLASGEMPPEDSDQPTAEERKSLQAWVATYLTTEAKASAGDPGPVLLRRLSNAEYTYTIRDLTGAPLDPAREFPVDGAAGEGFTNTGSALVMSPALFQKYLDAAKHVANHAVLVPDGIRFSAGDTRSDWTNEIVSEIRALYLAHTSGNGDVSKLNRWDVSNPLQATEEDGRVNLTRYFAALIQHRDRLQADRTTAVAIANEEKLNAKYFGLLADMLTTGEPKSLLLERVRGRLRTAKPEDAAAIAGEVRAWQDRLWTFSPVGHFGSIRKWQEPTNPLVENITLRQPIDANVQGEEVVLFLSASPVVEGANWGVNWKRPRLEFKDRPAILLRDIRPLAARIEQSVSSQLARTEEYLTAVAELRAAKKSIEDMAAEKKLDAAVLRNWTNYLDLGRRVNLEITGHMTNKMTNVEGKEAIDGWGVPATPCFLANSSDAPISFLTLTVPPHAVTAHPSPDLVACVAWRSPIAGRVRIGGRIADADEKCGNGATWAVELRAASGSQNLGEGTLDNGKAAELHPADAFDIRPGDLLIVRVGPRDRDHSCDTTHVDLAITEEGGETRKWDLSADVSPDIHAGNPHADRHGNKEVWHFFTESNTGKNNEKAPASVVPVGSALARWREAAAGSVAADELAGLAKDMQTKLAAAIDSLSDADKAMVADLTRWTGPLAWATTVKPDSGEVKDASSKAQQFGIDPAQFGKHPDNKPLDGESLFAAAQSVVEVRLPAALVRGGEFIVDGAIDANAPADAAAQLQLLAAKPGEAVALNAGAPLITRSGGTAKQELETAYNDFRSLFPAAMCYARIVPVDEVVTLVLFHREDDQLERLMLADADVARLDRLWDELGYVSQDALISVVAYEQILEFATQDRPDLVKTFQPLRKPITERADALKQRLIDTEPAHVDALVKFAAHAYRRPLAEKEQSELRGLYASLRKQDLPHEDAIRLLLARVLVSPAFLYRLEQPGPDATAIPVSNFEMASRLSYFLWSTAPDEDLMAAAAAGKLHDAEALKQQTKRMLRDERTRRLAIEFACQWLHVRNFDQLDEKSERAFPTFADVRGEMYEESIRFFADIIQNEGRVLDVLDADYTFLNEKLAKHYGVPNVTGDEWRKVQNAKAFARGGVLTQGTVLATQSGASRTSPILRGNWVSETLLGDRLPRPPKDVPVLPDDVPQGLTERQLIEKHSHDAACAKCHVRIDPYGFALEQFDAIGRFREKDAENHPLDVKSTLPDGTKLEGVDGLRKYLLTTRRNDFVRQFCRKLLGYSLGRSVQLSDQPLLDKMMADLEASDYRFSAAVEAIVLSEQFQNIRGSQFVGPAEGHDEEAEGNP